MVDCLRALAPRLFVSLAALAIAGGAAAQTGEQTAPALWGYGVKGCSAFVAVQPHEDTPIALADEDYLRYREWLAGFVSGLNFAIDRDVLRGAALDAAMLRIASICKENPEDDFFNASLRLVRSLGQLKPSTGGGRNDERGRGD